MNTLEMKVDALMRLCTAYTDADRAEAMAVCRKLATSVVPPTAENRELEAMIHETLLDAGVPDHLRGQRYLMTAIALTVKNRTATDEMVSYLYPTVAEVHNTSASRCERAMRHAVETAWDRGDIDVLTKYFGNSVSRSTGKTTNREFIARMANDIRARI